jgi:hypothetical protein
MRRFQSQWFAWAVAVLTLAAFTASAWAQRRMAPAPVGTRIQGHVVRVQAPDRFVVRTADRGEVILHTNARTRFLLNERPVRFEDLRERAPVVVFFDDLGQRHVASSVAISPAALPEEILEGRIVRVLEDDRLVVRSPRGREVIVVTEPRTVFTINERPARLADFRVETSVRINFTVRNRTTVARSVVAMSRRGR